jgi:peptide-methionine (S)-S-oxide reductase
MKKEKAIFAAGCFWHIEEVFSKTNGVIKTKVGYTGGKTENPKYEDVCTGKTGHAEAIEIIFDTEKVSYEELLDIFWKIHDPTSLNKQGDDVGTNYRSAIFYLNEKQKNDANKSKIDIQKIFNKPIQTEITKAMNFFPAEEYHQKYLEKHKNIFCKK